MISIIIPTLNEEHWLPNILKDIENQTMGDYEIIVADAYSSDATRKIALSYGCKVVNGGLPAKGRNEGAKVAKGDVLVFFDSDVRIKPDFLKNAYNEFQNRYLEIATCEYTPDTNEDDITVLYTLYNEYARTMQYVLPYCMGVFIIMTKRLFYRLEGFNESIKIGEDWDIAHRAAKIAKFRILDSVNVVISTRRIEKEGKFNYVTKVIKSNLHQLFRGNITKEGFIDYSFGHYEECSKKKKELHTKIHKLRTKLVKLKHRLKKQKNQTKRKP